MPSRNVKIKINNDTFVTLEFPNGQTLNVEFKQNDGDNPCLDFIFSEPQSFVNWKDINMNPAPVCPFNNKQDHIRRGDQIMIPLEQLYSPWLYKKRK